jgi:hypothetical protein
LCDPCDYLPTASTHLHNFGSKCLAGPRQWLIWLSPYLGLGPAETGWVKPPLEVGGIDLRRPVYSVFFCTSKLWHDFSRYALSLSPYSILDSIHSFSSMTQFSLVFGHCVVELQLCAFISYRDLTVVLQTCLSSEKLYCSGSLRW